MSAFTARMHAALPYRQFLGHRPRSASSTVRPVDIADPTVVPAEPAPVLSTTPADGTPER